MPQDKLAWCNYFNILTDLLDPVVICLCISVLQYKTKVQSFFLVYTNFTFLHYPWYITRLTQRQNSCTGCLKSTLKGWRFKGKPNTLHPVVVEVSPLMRWPLLVFGHVLLTSPFLQWMKKLFWDRLCNIHHKIYSGLTETSFLSNLVDDSNSK